MAKAKIDESKLLDLFAAADDVWICPVTGTKFARSATVAIEAHKAELLVAVAARVEEGKRQKLRDAQNAEGRKIANAQEFKSWLARRIELMTAVIVDAGKIELSIVKITSDARDGQGFKFASDRLHVKLPVEAASIGFAQLKKIGFTDKSVNGNIFVLQNSPFMRALLALALKKTATRLTAEQVMGLRDSNATYKANVDSMKVLRDQISSMRKQISNLESQNSKLREDCLHRIDVVADFLK